MRGNNFSKNVIIQTLNWISENIYKKITMSNLSDISGYSKWHFQKLFATHMNIAPATYIRRKKILMSLPDLKYGDKQVQSIANEYGFTSPQSYNRIFKSELGCTPTYCRIMFRRHGCFSQCNGVCKAANKNVQNSLN